MLVIRLFSPENVLAFLEVEYYNSVGAFFTCRKLNIRLLIPRLEISSSKKESL